MIAILMSTYNGERYLREQIDSILTQTNRDWRLYIRDDGSCDGTLDIIREYCHLYPDKIILEKDDLGNLGPGSSFMRLLEVVEDEYYMFCDQDDVWLPTKIEKTFFKLRSIEDKYGKDKGIGVFTDLTVVDAQLNVIMPSMWKGDDRHPEYIRNFYKQWTNRHATYGCTQMFNRAVKKFVFPYKQFEGVMGGHDNWLEYILIKKGHYDYLEEPTILYRQHGLNVCGAYLGHSKRSRSINLLKRPSRSVGLIIPDYRNAKRLPFSVSYMKVLVYRIVQLVMALTNKE